MPEDSATPLRSPTAGFSRQPRRTRLFENGVVADRVSEERLFPEF
jgi:hypothetical protein